MHLGGTKAEMIKYELDIKHITAYKADNANVNFGKHQDKEETHCD